VSINDLWSEGDIAEGVQSRGPAAVTTRDRLEASSSVACLAVKQKQRK
jgi:hypothetical protein